jgi:predicted MFS family arabinose efflux permease
MEQETLSTPLPTPAILAAPPFTRYQLFVVAMLTLLQFSIVLDFMIISPLGDILIKSLHLTTTQFGSVVSAYAISAGVSGLLTAGFADKFDRKKLLVFFYIGFIIGTIGCGLVNSYHTMLIARIVTGVFGGVVGSILMAIITDLFMLNQRGRVIGYVQMAFAGSQILGIPIGLVLAYKWGWHSTFFMVAGIAAFIIAAIMLYMKPITSHLALQQKRNALQHLWQTVKKRDYQTGFLATAVLSMGGFMVMPFTSAFLVNNVMIPEEKLLLVFFCTGLSTIFIMPLIGKLSDKKNKLIVFASGSALASIMILIYTNLGPTPIWLVIGINMILFMGIMSRMIPSMALNSAIPDAHDRGAFMSVNASLQQMAGGFAALVAGMIVVQDTPSSPIEHFNWLGFIMVGFMIVCVYLVYRVKKVVERKAMEAVAIKNTP